MNRRLDIVRLLADGGEHSGEVLAATLAVSRAAVWKQVRQLEAWGLEVGAVPGRGYRLPGPLDLLDAPRIETALPERVRDRLRRLEVAAELESTNETLLAVDDLPPGRFDVQLAEFQHQGRGRRGRRWIAPFGSGLCLSLNWSLPEVPPELPALSLVVGVALRRALERLGVAGVGLKWPNDVLLDGGKLGGVLIEMRAEAGGPAYLVIGIGLNVRLAPAARSAIGATGLVAAALEDASGSKPPARTELAAAVIARIVEAVEEFEQRGFVPFRDEWRAADALAGRAARVAYGTEVIEGTARGIDDDGALLLDIDGRLRRFVSGEASLRPAA